jgi:hypothetical protein
MRRAMLRHQFEALRDFTCGGQEMPRCVSCCPFHCPPALARCRQRGRHTTRNAWQPNAQYLIPGDNDFFVVVGDGGAELA